MHAIELHRARILGRERIGCLEISRGVDVGRTVAYLILVHGQGGYPRVCPASIWKSLSVCCALAFFPLLPNFLDLFTAIHPHGSVKAKREGWSSQSVCNTHGRYQKTAMLPSRLQETMYSQRCASRLSERPYRHSMALERHFPARTPTQKACQ